MAKSKQQNTPSESLEAAELLDILMNNLPDTIYFKDKEGRFIKINHRQAQTLGVKTPEDAIGRSDFDFFPESFAQQARDDELKVMKSSEAIGSKLERLIDDEGNVKWFSATKAPIKDVMGRSVGIVGVSRDVTERQEFETAMEELNSLRELLLDIITHDLRNPAGVIQSISQMAMESDPESELLKMINDTSGSLVKVLQNTTLLSQAAFGEQIPMETLDLVGVIHECVSEAKLLLEQTNLSVELALPHTCEVQANPLISEVFKNYLSNAIKYAPGSQVIQISLQVENDSILAKVKDQGTTIPKESREAVFLRQHQLDGDLKRGRGLGLAIVKRIARAHSGEVWVEPNSPRGNSFCLKLPHL